jgi:hypothetical protein
MRMNAVQSRTAGPNVDIDGLLERQRGMITRQQALECGFTDGAIRHQLLSGRWQRLLPALYANFTGQPTLEQRRFAAHLFAGPNAQITGVAALRWHGLRYLPEDERIHVLIPHDEQRTSYGFVRLQRAKELDGSAKAANGYVVCSVARAVADACRGLDDLRTVRAIVAEAVQRRLTTVAALDLELIRAGRHRTRLLRAALREVSAGAASAPESELQRILSGSKIIKRVYYNPTLVTEAGVPLPTPDAWIDDAALAVEVDSREHHMSPEGWQRTLNRHNALAQLGAQVLHLTPADISRPRRALTIVERAYMQRLGLGRSVPIRVVEKRPAR